MNESIILIIDDRATAWAPGDCPHIHMWAAPRSPWTTVHGRFRVQFRLVQKYYDID